MTRKEIISLIILATVIAYGTYKFITREYSDTHSRYMLDTIVEVSGTSNSKTITSNLLGILDYIQEFEKKFNEYDVESYISQINQSEQQSFPMDADLYEMLCIADSLYQITDGAFDITIKPVWDLWNFNSPDPMPPTPEVIDKQLENVGFDKLDYDQNTLYKPKGMQISLGAIAKGYIFDKAATRMQEMGIRHGFINSRSSISFFGEQVSPLVYITHPRNLDDTIASFRPHNNAVGTSGDYQQYFEYEGQRYHHIINAKSGYPVPNVFSVTVIHPSAAWADGLATALFVMSPEQAMDYATKRSDTNCVIYYLQDEGIVSLKSNGMKNLEFQESL